MVGVNKIILLGNVGKDPEVHEHQNKLALLTLATSKTYKKDGEPVTKTEWHNLVFWSGLANVVEKYVKKGMRIYVEGEMTYTSFTDKEGVQRIKSQVVVSNMQMLNSENKT